MMLLAPFLSMMLSFMLPFDQLQENDVECEITISKWKIRHTKLRFRWEIKLETALETFLADVTCEDVQ